MELTKQEEIPKEEEEEEETQEVEVVEEEEEGEEKSKVIIAAILDHMIYTIFICLVTVYALIADDFRIAFFGKDWDQYFYILVIACLVLFTIELLLSCYAKKDYMFSFFFYLDVVSTLSLVFDIGWVSDLVF